MGKILRSIPAEAMKTGSSEILNWVLTAGAVDHLPLQWSTYEPIYWTSVGTGVGLGFVTLYDEGA